MHLCMYSSGNRPPTHDDSQTRQKIADWLSPTDYGCNRSHLERITAPGSAYTVLHSQEYQEWVRRPGQTLHLRGDLGVGKTVTTSAIVHDLQNNLAATMQLSVAFIYCGYELDNERRPIQFLRNILKQLILAQSHVPQMSKSCMTRINQGPRQAIPKKVLFNV